MPESTISRATTEDAEHLSLAALALTMALTLIWFATQALVYWG